MNYNKYMTVETTFMDDCTCFSFQSNKDIENGSVAMSLESLLSICRALNVTPNDILLGEYLYPDVDDMLFKEPSNHLNFDDKILLQKIFQYMEERRQTEE